MQNQPVSHKLVLRAHAGPLRLGFWSAILLALLAIAAFAFGITTPPRSGPFCVGTCIVYPFTDAAQFVPRDYYWVVPALLLLPVFVIVVGCVQACVLPGKQHLSVITLCFASIAASIIAIDYFIQVQVAEPSLLRGETAGLALFTQYNPHGIFIAFEDLGYLALCVAFLFFGAAFPATGRLARAIRWTALGAAFLGFACFLAMMWRYGLDLEYRFEVAIITIAWTTLAILGVLLAVFFANNWPERSAPGLTQRSRN